jgi:RND family efflux transporter MFP subunit
MRALDPIPTAKTRWREWLWERRKTLPIFAVLAIAAVGILVRLEIRRELRHDAADSAIPTVTLAPVASAPRDEALVLPGTVQPYVSAPLYARTSGYVRRWLVDIGAPVKAGQLLAELDTPEVDQQFYQAQADLRTAESNEGLAKSTAARWETLLKTDSVSKQEAEEKLSDYKSKQAAAESARANVRRLEDLQNFKRIVAPFDGTVTARNIDIGQLVTTGSGVELYHVSDLKKLRIYVQVPEPYAQNVRPGLQASLIFGGKADKTYTATVERTADALDPTTRTLLTQLEVDNPNGELFTGAYTEVHFHMPAVQGVTRIPANALIFRGDGVQVAVPSADDHVHLKQITLGRDFGTELEVTSGLEPGAKVIVNPPDSLIDGQPIRIVPAAEPKKAPGGSHP